MQNLIKEINTLNFNTKIFDLGENKTSKKLGYIGRALKVVTQYRGDDQKEVVTISKEWSYVSRLGNGYNHKYRSTFNSFR